MQRQNNYLFRIFLLGIFVFYSFSPVFAANFKIKNLWGSTRSDEVNVRSGPSIDYPILFTYKVSNLPIHVIGEYEGWYKIEDKDKEGGWINKPLVTKKKNIIISADIALLFNEPDEDSRLLFRLEKDVIAKFIKCKGVWCKIKVEGKTGWVVKNSLWGVNF